MTPTSAPDLPDIDKVLQMTKDMELISDFLTNGRFVGDRVHVSIEHLADCIRNRPQSEASALATPVGWKLVPIEPTEDMYLSGCEKICNDLEDGEVASCSDVYKSMIAAAPPQTEGR